MQANIEARMINGDIEGIVETPNLPRDIMQSNEEVHAPLIKVGKLSASGQSSSKKTLSRV